MEQKKIYFQNLDGLRFFCFLTVFLYHGFHTESADVKASGVYQFFKMGVAENGFLGVNFFFVLSGFLITYLLIKEKQLNGKINIINFWIRRILRIWPLYFICVLLGFGIFPFAKSLMGGSSTETANIWYYLTFTNNFDFIKSGFPDAPGLGVLWSIAVEEQFYFIWPLLLSMFPVKRYWIVFSVVVAGSLIFRAANDVEILHKLHTLSCIGDMAIGGFGAWLILVSSKFSNYIRTLSRANIYIIYICLIAIFLFREELFSGYYLTRILERLMIAIIMLYAILEQCYSERSFFKMSKFGIPSRLGIITYGLYCLHFIFISGTTGLSKKLGFNDQVWVVVFAETIIALIITIIISKISYRYIELPFLKFKDKFAYFRKK